MAGRSMTTQVAQLQKEVTPGTAVTNAMVRPLGLKLVPGVHVEGGQSFTSAGSNVATAYMSGDEWGVWNVEGVQDFNSLGLVAASTLGKATTTTAEPGAYKHVFTPKGFGTDDVATYTAQFGDSVAAIQASQFAFNSFGLTIQRGTLGITSSALSRKLNFGATLATTGVTNIPAVPIHPTSYDVYADDTWATLGTTKMLACYEFSITNPDKFVPDAPINSAVDGFEQLVVGADRQFDVSISLALDAAGVAMVSNNFRNGAIKFFRVETEGALIGTTEKYTLTYDLAVLITGVGQVQAQQGSNIATLPLTGQLVLDPVADKFQELTLINTVATY